jgi:MATE family multidrug resistance protein
MFLSHGAVIRVEVKEQIRLAAPLAAVHAGQQMMSLVDTALAGRMGETEVAAVGLGSAVVAALYVTGLGLMLGLDPLMAQSVGARNHARAQTLLGQSLYLSLLVAVGVMVPMMLLPSFFVGWGVAADTAELAQNYIRIRALSMWPAFFFVGLRSHLQATGRTAPLVWAVVVGNVVNLAAGWLAVFGGSSLPLWFWPLTEMPSTGVPGLAVVTALCTLVQLGVVLLAYRESTHRPVQAWIAGPALHHLRAALRLGLPLALQMGAEASVFALVGVLAARLGTQELAAHQVALSLASFSFTVSLGISTAGCVRVGLAIGAQDARAARRSGMVAFACGGSFMAVSATLMFAFPELLAGALTNQPTLVAASSGLVRIAGVFQLSDGVQAVGAGVLRGAGDTKFLSVTNLLGHFGVGLPVALLLAFTLGQGIVGLWWGLCTGLSVVALALFLRFQKLSARAILPLAD